MKLVCAALLVALAIAAAAQQPAANAHHSNHPKPAIDYKALIERYVPFHAGEVRTYAYRGETVEGPGADSPVRTVIAEYTETVISVHQVTPKFRIVRLEISGGKQGADHTRCGVDPLEAEPDADDNLKVPWQYSYVFAGRFVFQKCNPGPDDSLELPGRYRLDEEGVDYILPLRVGRGWGREDGLPREGPHDTRWEWFVAGRQTISVPAGTFEGCFRLIYETNPDDTQRWICPGVGLVAEEYTHHGTLMHSRIELTSVTKPTLAK